MNQVQPFVAARHSHSGSCSFQSLSLGFIPSACPKWRKTPPCSPMPPIPYDATDAPYCRTLVSLDSGVPCDARINPSLRNGSGRTKRKWPACASPASPICYSTASWFTRAATGEASFACASANPPNLDSKSNPIAAPLDQPSFTFIDHDDDLTSKRIKDVNARKAIRSHVMRDVRRRERLAGLKRTSRRESRTHPVSAKSQSKVPDKSEERSLVVRSQSQSSTSSSVAETDSDDHLVCSKQRRGRPSRWSAGYPLSSHLNPNPRSLPTSWFFDPFCSLPGSFELPSVVAHLVYYCKWSPSSA